LDALLDVVAIDPFNGQAFYNLGLLYYELGDVESTLTHFKKASMLGYTDEGLFYNYGLALQQQGKLKEAENIMIKGHGLNPQSIKINYALAFFYMQQKQPGKARKYVETLYALDPNNPDYQELFRALSQ